MTTHVFVIGLDDFNLRQLRTIRDASSYQFHGLLPYDMVVNPAHYPIDAMIEQGRSELEAAGVPVHALIGDWEFPTTALLAVVPHRFAAGAIAAGGPYGAAQSVGEGLHARFPSPWRTPDSWGHAATAPSGRTSARSPERYIRDPGGPNGSGTNRSAVRSGAAW